MSKEDPLFRTIVNLMQQGHLDQAVDLWNGAPSRLRSTAKYLQIKGLILVQKNQLDSAVDVFEKAIKTSPKLGPLYVNLGTIYFQLEKFKLAVDTYDRGIRADPALAVLFYSRGLALKKLSRRTEAVKSFQKAVTKMPTYADAWAELSFCYLEGGDLLQAKEAAEQAVRLNPTSTLGWVASHKVAMARDESAAAEVFLDRILALAPGQPDALLELSTLQLGRQDFREGWPNYHSRWRASARKLMGGLSRTANPRYEADKGYARVLVWSEQGVGDDVFYVNMLQALGSWGPELIVSVDARLVGLLQRSLPDVRVVSRLETLPEDSFDAHLPMGDLGLYLDSPQVMAKRKEAPAYLRPRQNIQERLRKHLDGLAPGQKWCGLSWRSKAETIGEGKSVSLETLLPVLALQGYQFINLQYGEVSEELADLQANHGIQVRQLADVNLFNDIEGLTALINLCDAVVTVSNVTAHLSGALGRRTCLLRSSSLITGLWYWRNVLDDHNLWYPSVETMVQSKSGEWESAVQKVQHRLMEWL